MSTDIKILLPSNIVDALYAADTPSTSNPFLTSTDVANGLSWKKITKSYTDFAVVGMTNTITLYTPAVREVVHMVVLNPTVTFIGGAIFTYTISVDHYAPADLLPASNVFNAAIYPFSATNAIVSENIGPAAITATATSTNDNLSAATQGTATFWLLTSLLP